jgi:hypothetical protein
MPMRRLLITGLVAVVLVSTVFWGVLAFERIFVKTDYANPVGPLGSIPWGDPITDITWGKGRIINIEIWRPWSYSYLVLTIKIDEPQEGPEDIGLGKADQWAPI